MSASGSQESLNTEGREANKGGVGTREFYKILRRVQAQSFEDDSSRLQDNRINWENFFIYWLSERESMLFVQQQGWFFKNIKKWIEDDPSLR